MSGDVFDRTNKDAELLEKIITPEYPENPYEVLGLTNFKEPTTIAEEQIGTTIQEFYRNATVLVTGGTGFLGVILIEKLLRSCPHLGRIYVVVRANKEKTSKERFDQVLQNSVFKRLAYEYPQYRKKLLPIDGNLERSNIGLSDNVKCKLQDEVNVVFHCAATVRFNEKLQLAVKLNTLATRELMHMAKNMKQLKAFVYVSTAFSMCPLTKIEEKVPEMGINYKEIINQILVESTSEKGAIQNETEILGHWPNTYTYSKALSEFLIKEEHDGLPIGIFRPSIVTPTYREPIKGWTNSVNGCVGVVLAEVTGLLHVFRSQHKNNLPDPVPVDFVANGLICVAQDIYETYAGRTDVWEFSGNSIPVYNFVNGNRNPITMDRMVKYAEAGAAKWPTLMLVWFPSIILRQHILIFDILSFVLHTMTGRLLDFISIINGKKAVTSKMYEKINFATKFLDYFVQHTWQFDICNMERVWKNLNTEDRDLFLFDVRQVQWKSYVNSFILGTRISLLNDDLDTLPVARKKHKKNIMPLRKESHKKLPVDQINMKAAVQARLVEGLSYRECCSTFDRGYFTILGKLNFPIFPPIRFILNSDV